MTGTRRQLTIGVIGSGWIVRAHTHALHTLNHLHPLPARIRIKWIYGRRADKMAALADACGVERATTDWQQIIDDPAVDVIVNAGAHPLHAPVSLAAVGTGKHVLCEKPLAVHTDDARRMERAAEQAGVLASCGFNYRFVPAVQLLRSLLVDGRLGEIRHYRAVYLQDWLSNNPDWPGGKGGSAVRDYTHLFDMTRHLVGEPVAVVASARSILSEADDAFIAAFEMANGASASLEASCCATGWKGRQRLEVNGSLGSAWWDMEEFHKLHVMFVKDQAEGVGGFRDVLVTESSHPFMRDWWEPGHVVGWESTFVHQWRTFLSAVLANEPLDPMQASFRDGVRANEMGDAVLEAARQEHRVRLAHSPPSEAA